jgi:hypothetical protein
MLHPAGKYHRLPLPSLAVQTRSCTLSRTLRGTLGKSRRVSLMTARRYGILRRSSRVGARVDLEVGEGEEVDSSVLVTSSLSLRRTAGC